MCVSRMWGEKNKRKIKQKKKREYIKERYQYRKKTTKLK